MSRVPRIFLLLASAAACLSACAPAAPTPDIGIQRTQAVQTAFASMMSTQADATPEATTTPTPTLAAPRTPPALPPAFTTSALNPLDPPHTYVQDACQYIKDKWDSTRSAPGTIVMIVMFHSISKDKATDPNQISAQTFTMLINDLHDQGFGAIDMQQFSDFMYSNARIPARSVLLIVDDRHFAEYFTDHFQPYYEKWGWPVINAYIAKDERPDLWQQNASLAAAGWVDYQAHGVVHNIPISSSSSDDYITSELQGAITNLQKYFHKTPIAYIWPGGGFTPRAAEFARRAGYLLGFTVNPRGPVMYNWVPLANQEDPARPYFLPEGPVNDPLLVLPRFWDVDARAHLDEVRQIGNAAAEYAQQNKATEMEYYDIVCAPTLGPIP
jgi:polysaccharide deacetylase